MNAPDPSLPAHLRLRGRAAGSNHVGRFERHERLAIDDGWDIAEDAQVARTEIRREVPRSVITRNASPDVPFDRSINPYRGCEHGCIYCFARPTHAFLGLSPGLDFETRLIARPGAAAVLARELRAARYKVAPIAIGTNTDPYQPAELGERVMREILEVLRDFNHPVSITTKGTLIERDLDILAPMAALNLVRVGISLTTLDADLSRKMEPRAPAPARRLATMRALSDAGVPVRAMIAPVVPALTDHELEALLEAAAGAGARNAAYILLRLPLEVAPLFRAWLDTHVPDRAARVMGRVRDLHGGRDYDATFGKRMHGEGPFAQLMAQRFDLATRRLGLVAPRRAMDCTRFAPPPRQGDQLSLF